MCDSKGAIQFDSTDWPGMISLMNRHAEFDTMIECKNQDDELMHLSILEDHIVCVIYQHNHWIRKMMYHRDGTVEEMYDGKWED